MANTSDTMADSNIDEELLEINMKIKTQVFMFSSNAIDYDTNFLVGVFTSLINTIMIQKSLSILTC